MTDALTRAARAIRTFYLGGVATETGNRVESCFVGDPDAIGRSAILSFLDGEDVVEACARAMCASQLYASAWDSLNEGSKESYHKNARASLAALRALVQAPDKTQEDGK